MPLTNAKLTGKRCQCPTCKEVFSTEANFTRHRKGTHGVDRHCVDPVSVGLVLSKAHIGGVWSMPGQNDVNA